jgi:uncharacterized protein
MDGPGLLGPIPPLGQGGRIAALFINSFVAWLIFHFATGLYLPGGSGASVWFLAAVAYWLLTLIAAPFFLPPKDSLGTAIAVILLLVPIDLGPAYLQDQLGVFLWLTVVVALFVVVTALVAAFGRDHQTPLSKACYRLSGAFGKGEILFTPAVIVSAVGFYQNDITWTYVILAFWTFVVAARPAEIAIQVALYLSAAGPTADGVSSVGTIFRVDDPNLVRVALVEGVTQWSSDTVHIAKLSNGDATLILPLFVQTQGEGMIGTGLCVDPTDVEGIEVPSVAPSGVFPFGDADLAGKLGGALCGEAGARTLVGIVVEGSSIETIKFQAIGDVELEEGMVVSTQIRQKKVYYQILDASTKEEAIHQNPLGMHIVSAAQLGFYGADLGFQKFPWLPTMNQPVFLAREEKVEEQKLAENEFLVGNVPHTPFGVPVGLEDLVEYHTAILGITGTGKTELALDIIRNAVERGTKVFCVDFTGEYRARLADLKPLQMGLTIEQGGELEKLLFAVETGTYGAPKEKEALKKFLDAIKPGVWEQVKKFLEDKGARIALFELNEITNTKATLRTTEMYLSAIMAWARKNRKAERILIALEEAHTIVPEAYGSGFDAETQWVVGRIGQIALQGRKYGVGLLLISQRTALVSKTILSQCNTYFTHALVDKTSLDYLSSVYSADHVRAIPNLRFLEFIASGKAVRSERPVLAKRTFDQAKLDASRALDRKREPASDEHEAAAVVEIVEEVIVQSVDEAEE